MTSADCGDSIVQKDTARRLGFEFFASTSTSMGQEEKSRVSFCHAAMPYGGPPSARGAARLTSMSSVESSSPKSLLRRALLPSSILSMARPGYGSSDRSVAIWNCVPSSCSSSTWGSAPNPGVFQGMALVSDRRKTNAIHGLCSYQSDTRVNA